MRHGLGEICLVKGCCESVSGISYIQKMSLDRIQFGHACLTQWSALFCLIQYKPTLIHIPPLRLPKFKCETQHYLLKNWETRGIKIPFRTRTWDVKGSFLLRKTVLVNWSWWFSSWGNGLSAEKTVCCKGHGAGLPGGSADW